MESTGLSGIPQKEGVCPFGGKGKIQSVHQGGQWMKAIEPPLYLRYEGTKHNYHEHPYLIKMDDFSLVDLFYQLQQYSIHINPLY